MNNKAAVPLIYLLIAAGVLILLVSAGSLRTASLTGSGEYINSPIFRYVKCEQQVGNIKETTYSSLSDGSWAAQPNSVPNYDVIIKAPNKGNPIIQNTYIIYSKCLSKVDSMDNCPSAYKVKTKVSPNQEIRLSNVVGNQYVTASYVICTKVASLEVGCSNSGGLQYKEAYLPYGLRVYDLLNGGDGGFINNNDCTIQESQESWKDRLLSTDSAKVNSNKNKGEQNNRELKLEPNEVRYYVTGYLARVPSDGFVLKYNGQDAWCRSSGNGAQIYKINSVTLGSGTYKIASLDWNDKLADKECCPGETIGVNTCSKDYKFVSTENSVCSALKPCDGGSYVPYSDGKIVRYRCVSGKCQKEFKDVECSQSSECNSNQICDKSTWKCVNANVNLDGYETTPAPDNAAACEQKGGTWIKSTEQEKVWYNYLGIGTPKTVVNEYCKFSSWIDSLGGIIGIIALIAIVAGLIFFGKPIYMTIRGILRR